MNVSKLLKAAQMIQSENPGMSDEISQIAQNIQNTSPASDGVNNMVNENPENEAGMNPNIDQKYVQPMSGKVELHRITLSIEVPENTDETFLINAIMTLRDTLSEKGFRLKGYSFDERTKG